MNPTAPPPPVIPGLEPGVWAAPLPIVLWALALKARVDPRIKSGDAREDTERPEGVASPAGIEDAMASLLISRRSAIAALAAAVACPVLAYGEQSAASGLRFRAIKVDVSGVRESGDAISAEWLAQDLPEDLRKVFAPYLAPGDSRAPILLARIDLVTLGSEGSGGGPNLDSGRGLYQRRGRRHRSGRTADRFVSVFQHGSCLPRRVQCERRDRTYEDFQPRVELRQLSARQDGPSIGHARRAARGGRARPGAGLGHDRPRSQCAGRRRGARRSV